MSGKETLTYVVEFWAKPSGEVKDQEIPQSTVCTSSAAALALETEFHKIGWAARALTLRARVERDYLAS